MRENTTRVAVVQIDFLPAFISRRRSPLDDPSSINGGEGFLTPSMNGKILEFRRQLADLRSRIRNSYIDQLWIRIEAIIDACIKWNVKLVVFPEYSIPWELLPNIAVQARDIIVVAGTHTVEKDALTSEIYSNLGWDEKPLTGLAVCPVLINGKISQLQPKLNASPFEDQLRSGDSWAPVNLGSKIPGPMGVLICLDFLFRESKKYKEQVFKELEKCRFVVVPSLTPSHTIEEFSSKAWEEARRYGRPVLYSDGAAGGGTSIYVDEGRIQDLRNFPDNVGVIEKGDEGLIIADVNLNFTRVGPSKRYERTPPVASFAAGTLVYRTYESNNKYSELLAGLTAMIEDETSSLDIIISEIQNKEAILIDGSQIEDSRTRHNRIRRLLYEMDGLTEKEQCRQFLRDIILPIKALPMNLVLSTLLDGAADEIHEWNEKTPNDELARIENALREHSNVNKTQELPVSVESNQYISALRQAVRLPEPDLRHLEEISRIEYRHFNIINEYIHAIGQPLQFLRNETGKLLRLLANSGMHREDVQRRIKKIDNAFTLINNARDRIAKISRLGKPNLDVTYSTTDVNELVNDCCELMGSLGVDKRVSIKCVGGNVSPLCVDVSWLRLAIINLIDNAIKYSFYNRIVLVKTRESAGQVYFTIENYGIEIPKSDMERIFQPFMRSRVPDPISQRPGMGLGLTLVKQAVERVHRGLISVSSTPAYVQGNKEYRRGNHPIPHRNEISIQLSRHILDRQCHKGGEKDGRN